MRVNLWAPALLAVMLSCPPAQSAPFTVVPDSISTGWAHWSFVTLNEAPGSEIRSLRLTIDGKEMAPRLVDRTGPGSRVWTFRFPARPAAEDCTLRIERAGRRDSVLVLGTIRRWATADSTECDPGVAIFVPAKGALGYPVGSRSCTLAELASPDPDLSKMLHAIGVFELSKIGRTVGETPPFAGAIPQVSRTYVARFSTGFSAPAIAQALKSVPIVEDAHLACRIIAQ